MGKLKKSHYLGYACGELGYTVQNSLIASYMVMYWTTAAGVSAMTIGTMTLICRILDAFTDVGFGVIADHTHSKLGKFRPWYMGSIVPTTIAFILLFTLPDKIAGGSAAAVLFLYIVYILWGSIFATVDYQWLSVMPAMSTDDLQERKTMSTWRQWAAAFAGFIVSIAGMPLILKFGMGDVTSRNGYRGMAIIMGLVTLVFFIISAITVKEKNHEIQEKKETMPKLSMKQSVQIFKGNRLLFGALIINVMSFMLATVCTSFASYYYTYYVGNPIIISTVMTIACVVGTIFNSTIGPVLSQKFNREPLYLGAGVGIILCYVLTYFCAGNIVMLTVSQCIFQCSIQLFNAIVFRTIPDAIDWGEWKHGVQAPGIVSATISFVQKIGMGVATFLVTLALTIAHFDGSLAEQTAATKEGIRLAYSVMPVAAILISLIGFFLIRSVKKSERIQMHKDLCEKRGIPFDEKHAIN